MPISVSTSKTCRSGASAIVINSRATPLRQLRAIAAMLCVTLAGCASGDMRVAASIDDLLRPYVGNVPGASVLVIHDGVPLLRRSYGLADLEKKTAATPQTNYRLASITKQFTASDPAAGRG
jgi:CubicO group peptidase (beta-lactamase class C family)